MKKVVTYTSFTLATGVVVVLFLTAKTYSQLAIAMILYPGIAYLVLNLFPRTGEQVVTMQLPNSPTPIQAKILDSDSGQDGKIHVSDIDKRVFLKLIGAAGLSFFLFSLFSKKAGIPLLGKLTDSSGSGNGDTTIKNSTGTSIDPAEHQPTDGYQITEIDDNLISYYGFTKVDGPWFIMREDTDTNSFRYAKGSSDFTGNWANRSKLLYDYYYKVF